MSSSKRTATTPGEALAVVAVCFGLPILLSLHSVLAGLRVDANSFSDAGMLSLVGYELVLALVAVTLLRRRGYDIASLRPRPTWIDSGLGVLLALAAGVAAMVAMAPLRGSLAEKSVSEMMQHATVSPPTLLLAAIVNGSFEEVFLLAFLMRGLRDRGLSFSLGVMLLVRLSYHLYQGPSGALSVLGVGLVFGLFYARTQRLWPVVFAHMMWDVIPFLT